VTATPSMTPSPTSVPDVLLAYSFNVVPAAGGVSPLT
jgi:hypothetical protein